MVSPALEFNGNCKEALELYERAFNATDIFIDYYDSAPSDSGLNEKGDMAGKIMHSGITIYGTMLNMSDSERHVEHTTAIKFNVFVPDGKAVEQAYSVLKEGGRVMVELGKQFFSPLYAAVIDKFGIYWQIIS